jgi:hypothetical protein
MSTFREGLELYRDNAPIELQVKVPGVTQAVYYQPITLGDQDKVRRHLTQLDTDSPAVAIALSVIFKIRDQDGKPILDVSDKKWLMETVPQSILTDIVNEMAAGAPSVEEAEKN